jgi:Tfp pilus assembly protein PilN
MGEINFITKEVDSASEPKNKAPKKEEKASRWTPPAETAESASVPVAETDDKNRIEKSRQEVLEIIDKKKDGKALDKSANMAVGQERPSWFKKFFGANKETAAVATSAALPSGQKLEAKAVNKTVIGVGADKSGDSPMIFNNNTWNNSGVMATNLIDKTDYSFFDTGKKIRYLLAGVMGAVFVIAVLYLGLLTWEHLEYYSLKEQEEKIKDLRNDVLKLEMETKEAKLFQEKLSFATRILDKHIYWSNFFNLLESVTLPEVVYTGGINLQLNSPYNFRARTDDYESMKNQLMVLAEHGLVKNLKLSDVSDYEENQIQDEGQGAFADPAQANSASSTEPLQVIKRGVEFGLDFEIDGDIFYNPSLEAEPTETETNVLEGLEADKAQ